MVRTYCKIQYSRQFEPLINHLYLIVDILCSTPTHNTHLKRNTMFHNVIKDLHNNSINQQYFFTLPNTIDNDMIIQVIEPDTTCYDLQELDEDSVTEWKEMKKNKVKSRWMKQIRERAGVLKKLKRELQHCHKLSRTESGFLGVQWWILKYWDRDMGLKVKKKESPTPPLSQYMTWTDRPRVPKIKVKTPPTLPLHLPTTTS